MTDTVTKLLLVEDNPADARMLEELLAAEPALRLALCTAKRLAEALGRLKQGDIDLVLLDLGLPDSQGLETLSAVLGAAPDVPVVVLTGMAPEASLTSEALRRGAQDYLVKGRFDADHLSRSIRYSIERHRLRKEVLASESRLRAAAEGRGEVIVLLDPAGTVTLASELNEQLLGYPGEEYVGRSLSDFATPEDRPCIQAALARVIARPGESSTEELGFHRKDGQRCDLEVVFVNRLADPSVRAVIASYRDVTERRRANDLRERLAAVVESSDDAVITKSLQGTITSWNQSAERIFGYTAAEIVGKPITTLFPKELLNEEVSIIERIRRGERVLHYETRRLRKDGTEIEVSLTISPLRDARGRVVGASKIARDVTERRRLETQLAQAQKMEAIGRLAGGVAHDFNNLLTVIGGYSSFVLERIGPQDPSFGDVQEIAKAGERAAALTRQLLAFSRKQILQPRMLDLNDLIRQTERMLKRLIGEDVGLVTIAGQGLGIIRADPGQIEQVIMNLSVNARDAMPQGGKLTFETSNVYLDEEYARAHPEVSPGHYVMLAVTDTGTGMDKTTMGHRFEPFFSTKEVGKGTGLGLSTVFGIVRQSGGHIWVYSEPGQGTAFKLYFPRANSQGEPLERLPAAAREPRGTEKVLVVEDDPGVRAMSCTGLRQFGYMVLEAQDGFRALEICRKEGVALDLVVTDVVMPGMSGRQLADALKELIPALRILFVSGYTENAIVHHGVLDPGIPFLQKPFSPIALAEKVRKVLDATADKRR